MSSIPAILLDDTILAETSILIKTFERPACLKRLVTSIREYYPEVAVLLADDSRSGSILEGVEYYRLPFDFGAGGIAKLPVGSCQDGILRSV